MNSRDLEYEETNIAYDWQYTREDGGGVKCKNYEFCASVLPKWWFECKGCYICTSCDMNGFGEMEFITCTDECAVCMESHSKKVVFPAGCGHSFCINCSRQILLYDEARYHLSPVPYGCPSCPNGCKNPIKGEQCYCEEYDPVQEEWKENYPAQFKQWKDDENYSISNGENDIVFGQGQCPLCRKQMNYPFRSPK
jgi:hypothetical protein